MDLLILALFLSTGALVLKSQEQRKRVGLLSSYLGNYQIEKLMETLSQGYVRALGESDPQRQAQVWAYLEATEVQLGEQFQRFAAEFSKVDETDARVSKWSIYVPYASKLFPAACFDMRRVLAAHAQGISQTAQNSAGRSAKDKAFTMLAEMLLMQHTCHWFCKSKLVASARMAARHQTAYAQLLSSVSAETRRAYQAVVAG